MTTISAKIDDSDKDSFENIISSIGLNVTTAITAFVKAVIRENGLPFELKAKNDPYIYSDENLKYLHQAIAQVEGGKGQVNELKNRQSK